MVSNGESGDGRSSNGKTAFLRPQKIRRSNTNSGEIADVKCQIAFGIVKVNCNIVFLLKWTLMENLEKVRMLAGEYRSYPLKKRRTNSLIL